MPRIEIAQLREKVELLRRHPELMPPSRDKNKPPTDPEICEWMQERGGTPQALHHTELTKGKGQDSLTSEHARSFMLAFFDPKKRPTDLDPKRELDPRWLDLLAEPADAFRALVRLRGGQCGGPVEGEGWDEFFTPKRHRADEVGQSRIALLRPGQQRSTPPKGLDRLLPPGAVNPFPEPDEPMEPVFEGEKISFRISLQQAVKGGSAFCHLLVVQEVDAEGHRQFVPLVPYPAPAGAIMPPTHVPASSVTIPANLALHALEVPGSWGRQRRIIVVITQHALKLEGLPASEPPAAQLTPSFMDLLAARLRASADPALMRFEYLVWPARTN